MLICCYFYIETTEYKPVKLDTRRTVKLHPRVTVIYCRYMVWSFILSKYWGSFNSDCFRFFNKANSAHQIISSYLPFGAQRSCATLIDLLHWSQLCSFLLPMTCFHFSVTRTWSFNFYLKSSTRWRLGSWGGPWTRSTTRTSPSTGSILTNYR